MKRLAVVALGGNALQRGNELGTIEQQEKNAYETCVFLLRLLKADFNLVITHGNGPQVGNILLRNEAGYNSFKIPKMPLDICVADSQGSIGYMIERALRNVFNENKIKRNVVSMITQVKVDKNDPAFEKPTKPIGGFYLKEEADLLTKSNGWVFKEDARKRGWRRVVASPTPLEVMNNEVIKDIAVKGTVVIASGGGGIPVFEHENSHLEAIEAVIDKDLASALLAREIGADALYILTDVPKVYINFNKPNQKALDIITCEEAQKYFDLGEFGSGSMGPKIHAAIDFIKTGGKEAVITEASQLVNENYGTRIINPEKK